MSLFSLLQRCSRDHSCSGLQQMYQVKKGIFNSFQHGYLDFEIDSHPQVKLHASIHGASVLLIAFSLLLVLNSTFLVIVLLIVPESCLTAFRTVIAPRFTVLTTFFTTILNFVNTFLSFLKRPKKRLYSVVASARVWGSSS